jgi:1-phosphatidylinositol-3-phosphate 5-kinase
MAQDPPHMPASLHQLHAKASRSSSLTTFDDLTSPPPATIANDAKSFDMVQSGLSGLYSRLKASVGGAKEQGHEPLDAGAVVGATSKEAKKPPLPRSPAGTAVSSPVVVSVHHLRLPSQILLLRLLAIPTSPSPQYLQSLR